MKEEKSFFRKFILTCNPWFLASTVLILGGIYSLYSDPAYEKEETKKVLFSFISLEVYQFAALGAVFFFRKLKQLHDSVMLIVISSLLFLVPFINLSYAAEVNENFAFTTGMGMAVSGLCLLQLFSMKKFYRDINLPPMLICCGLVLIMANFLIPMTMNVLNAASDKSGGFMLLIWKYAVPVLAFTSWFTLSKVNDGTKLYQRKWLPVAMLGCWVGVSLVNFISISFVYSVEFKTEYIGLIGYTVFHIIRLMYTGKGSGLDKFLLWGVMLFPVILRDPLPLHFTIMLLANFALLYSERRRNEPLLAAAVIMLAVNLYFMNTAAIYSEIHFLVASVLIFSTFYAFKDRSYEKSFMSALLYLVAVKLFYGEITFLSYFESLSIIVLNMVFWKVEETIKEKLFIAAMVVLWAGVGILVQMTGEYYATASLAVLILNIALIRFYIMRLFIPKSVIVCSALLLTGDFITQYFHGMSRSMLITLLGFSVFALGVYMTARKAKNSMTH